MPEKKLVPSTREMFDLIKFELIKKIEDSISYDDCQISINEYVLSECISMWKREIETAQKIHHVAPNDYRIAGYLAFWVRKLKPFSLSSYGITIKKRKKLSLLINELVAIQLGLYILYIDEKRNKHKLSPDLLMRTIKTMRYRSISPHTMGLMYEFFFQHDV